MVTLFSYNMNHKCSSIVISGGFFFFGNFIGMWTYRNIHANLKCDEFLQIWTHQHPEVEDY